MSGTTKINVFWMGTTPTKCDHCGIRIHSVFVDGATEPQGRWGILHPACHRQIGRGLGIGRGQKYEVQEDGKWMKVEG